MVLALFVVEKGNAQNAFGALHSNYTPTNSLYINPSSMLDAKVWLDVNVVGVGAYANNDLAYLKNHSLISVASEATRGTSTVTDRDVGYNQSRKKYHAYNRNFVAGPSAVWSQGDHAAAISIGGRSYTAVRRVPDYAAHFIENGVPNYTAQHDINYVARDIRFASVNFAEIKLSYAHTFLKRGRNMFMGGVTFSKFFSIAGAGANIYNFDFIVDNDTVVDVFNLKSDAVYAVQDRLNAKGGWGMDFGFTFQRMLSDATRYYPNSKRGGCRQLPYLYKIGLSVIDIGNVKFDPVLYAGYDFNTYDWYQYANTNANEDNPTDLFAPQEPDIDNGVVRHPNKIRLPTFVSAQFDYNVWASRVYVNATIVQGFSVSDKKFGLRHANSLSITPRYESYWVDFALPVSLYEYKYPQLGASLRLGPLTIGTDKLINWLFKSRIYGADIYVYLKIPIPYHPSCADRMKGHRRNSRDKSPTKCTI
ncbi:MAG: hypothetical protein A3D92_20305 [Bacteroidetes bacterium RIFCSPHIGHO2_02_FULL_44_7]|nr:MAG: hypothetical protein A3D92_20305 [Bacteroidetes bacterium RIFCSPHIGHO2_02_FULL_44_7]